MSNYEYLGKKEIYKRATIRDILYPFLLCQKIKRAAVGAVASCPAISPGYMYIDKLTKIFYDFMIYTFKLCI